MALAATTGRERMETAGTGDDAVTRWEHGSVEQNEEAREVTKRRVIAAVVLTLGLLIGGIASCSGYDNARGRGDAPVGPVDDSTAEVINFPDHFGSVATKCDKHGHRLFVVTHDSTDAAVTVIADPSCPGGAAR